MATFFEKQITLTGNKALKARAAQITTTARIAYQNKVNSLLNEKTQLELKLQSLTDLAPLNTYSTTPNVEGFDPVEWVDKVQELEMNIWKINVEYDIAVRNYNKFFTEEDTQKASEQ